jgi:signal transduction histidine kinase
VQAAADLAAKEANEGETEAIYAAIDELHRELDAYLIPMGAPTRVLATSDRLLGLDPGGWYLDPDDLRLEASASRFLGRSLLLVASVFLLALAATNHISRKAFDRRTRVEMSLRMLRHDLLAPLATIQAYAERVRDPKTGEALLSEAEAALAVAEDARFVLQEGRLQAHGSASTRLRDEVVEPILDSLRRRSSYEAAEEPTITVALPDEPVSVAPEVAKFVVRNLLENAWRHRGDRPLVLELAGTVSGGSFHVEVKDHGPGMTTDDVEQLFRPGYRSEATRRDFVQGTGMGLHLARSALRLHGGDIELRRAAAPTIFTIRFPLAPTGRGKPNELPERETP